MKLLGKILTGPIEVKRCLPHRRADDVRFIADVYSQLTGRPVGKVRVKRTGAEVDHDDGRTSAAVTPPPVRYKLSEHMDIGKVNDFRERLYAERRETGASHDEAVAVLFPEGKVRI